MRAGKTILLKFQINEKIFFFHMIHFNCDKQNPIVAPDIEFV